MQYPKSPIEKRNEVVLEDNVIGVRGGNEPSLIFIDLLCRWFKIAKSLPNR